LQRDAIEHRPAPTHDMQILDFDRSAVHVVAQVIVEQGPATSRPAPH